MPSGSIKVAREVVRRGLIGEQAGVVVAGLEVEADVDDRFGLFESVTERMISEVAVIGTVTVTSPSQIGTIPLRGACRGAPGVGPVRVSHADPGSVDRESSGGERVGGAVGVEVEPFGDADPAYERGEDFESKRVVEQVGVEVS